MPGIDKGRQQAALDFFFGESRLSSDKTETAFFLIKNTTGRPTLGERYPIIEKEATAARGKLWSKLSLESFCQNFGDILCVQFVLNIRTFEARYLSGYQAQKTGFLFSIKAFIPSCWS